MSIIAIRRNLAPGAVFFRQLGNIVEYSLDRETWMAAFVLPSDAPTIPQNMIDAIEQMTLDEFKTLVQGNFGQFTSAQIEQIAANPATRIEQNLCAGAQMLAATFVAIVNYRLEDEADDETSLAGAGAQIAGLALEIIKHKFKLKFAEKTIKWINAAIVGATATEAATVWYESLDNAADLTDCDIQGIACAIYKALKTSGVDKEAVAESLIVHDAIGLANACGDSNLSSALVEWFTDWLFDWPELWSAFLMGLTDQEFIACECGGCEIILPTDCTIEGATGYLLLTGGIKTIPKSPTAEKGLVFNFPIEVGQQVDTVRLDFITTQYSKHSTIGWVNVKLAVRIFGLVGVQTYSEKFKAVTELSPYLVDANTYAGAIQSVTFDFTDITFTGGTTGTIRVSHMLAQGVNGLGADTVFTGGEICYRGP